MLDIQFIRENRELVEKSAQAKNIKADIGLLLQKDEQRRVLLKEVEELRQQRNTLAETTQGQKPDSAQITQGKLIKEKLAGLEDQLANIETERLVLLKDVPNIIPADTPEGGEENNREEKKWGETKQQAIDHLTWGEARGFIDFERGAKVAGNKFYYLKGPLVELEMAVFQLAMRLAVKHGFTPMTVPHLVNTKTVEGTGFLPRGEEKQIYKIEGEDLNLIATAEIPITGYHSGEILSPEHLPILYAGLSPAYRMEAGAYGKHSRGLYRVHQFNKLELYVFCKPEDSEKWHQKLIEIEEELCQILGIPYRLVRIAAADLGAPAYKKYDVEYWSPVDQAYHELMSCSNVTDYQARRLNIKYKGQDGGSHFVHTLNATALAFSRTAIALIENGQDDQGNVVLPQALQPFLGRESL